MTENEVMVVAEAGVKVSNSRNFLELSKRQAVGMLNDWVGPEKTQQVASRLSVALLSAAQSSRNPEAFYKCTNASVAAVVAIAALTNIMPSSGANALAYAIPRPARKGEKPNLTYQLSHRGLNALAQRSGMTMIAIPIGNTDTLRVTVDGDVEVVNVDLDNPPIDESEFRGILMIVKSLETGKVIHRGWVPKKIIDKSRDSSDAYQYALREEYARRTDPWHNHYVPMAMKTAMHYCVSRGWCVIDDTEALRAMEADINATKFDDDDVSAAPKIRVEDGNKLASLTAKLTEVIEKSGDSPVKFKDVEPGSSVEQNRSDEEKVEVVHIESIKSRNMAIMLEAQGAMAKCDMVMEIDKIRDSHTGSLVGSDQDKFIFVESINNEAEDRKKAIRAMRGK